MKDLYKILWLIALIFVSCGKDDTPTTEPPVAEIKEGFNLSPAEPDADKELTIIFKAPKTSALYGYKGDVYIHTGVVSEGQWLYVPATWEQNLEKCKMAVVEPNVWSITLSPSIRQWFGSGETPVTKIGIVIRSADGTKKGLENDFFITVTDNRFHPFEPAAIKYAPLPDNIIDGINIINNSTVTLVLYDKDKEGNHKDFAHVVGDFNNWTLSNDEQSQMYRDDNKGCWWITLSGLDADKEYAFQYYVGTKNGEITRLADAYARKILDPEHDPDISDSTYPDNKTYPKKGAIGIVSVFKIQPDSYSWQVSNFTPTAVDNLVIYEMLLRDFTTTSDINGALQKLDYLQSMGITAIELMPVQEFDGNDSWGYNPCFYFAMDKAYGTDHMYKHFIDECHKRGMAVILDVVYNHATGNSPFAKMWWDSANNRPAANNPYFNVTAPHPYSVFNDFNHESPLVRKFVKRNLQFLLNEYKFDGFRFDLSKGFTQKSSTEATAANYDPSRIAILKDYHAAIKAVKPNAYVILEHFCDDREEKELGDAGMMVWRNMNWNYCQSAMGWQDGSDFSGAYYSTSSRPANSLVSYMESHDEERAAYKQIQWGNGILKTDLTARMSQLEANAAFFFTVPGPKMVWQFGEMGYDISIDYNGRTGKKPVKWDYLEVPQRKKLHDTYAKLIQFRNDNPELFNSTATMSWKVSESDWEKGRFLTLSSFGNAKQIVVIGNFTNEAITTSTTFPKTGTWHNYMNPSESLNVSSTTMDITLPANNFKMFSTFQP
ncbi:alpha-amylase family glycosyl hydrolase [Anaerorudis cellulosivorans]|uniref:alpha-amylase family glycosyl hydrolase n=1 Tax=Anaerorudis cellulosivorans TaxID=3397862 RepID=UPI002220A678|nr:alpha-amylase family glycosyl hydrolase [Seramator thermalis]MCW1735907.1 alpha-amylase family glycosyl hydrolase [Seramator thermalis]